MDKGLAYSADVVYIYNMPNRRKLHRIIDGVKRKECSKCNKWLILEAFYNDREALDKLSSACKACGSIRSEAYRINNREKILERSKIYRTKNRDKLSRAALLWQRENSKRFKAVRDKYNKTKEGRTRKRRYRIKYRSTLKGYLSHNISKGIGRSLKGNKASQHWEDIVGYTLEQLKRRLKRTMPDGYTWQDYLNGELHIDHKVPIAVFNFDKPEDIDFNRCWALKNLQLLPAKENMSKKDNLTKHFQPSLIFQ